MQVGQVFVSDHPLILHNLTVLRAVQTEPKLFREMVADISRLLFFEATHDLKLTPTEVQTPLTKCTGQRIAERIALVPVLRAGLGMAEAVLQLVPFARVWHLGVYRDHETHQPITYYNKLPPESDTDLTLVVDPMLATGGSAIATVSILKKWGARHIKFLGLIAAPEGVKRLHQAHPDVPIHLAALDSHLNEKCYIVPGLGDAGDRQFGTA